jgi:hypothetical protein
MPDCHGVDFRASLVYICRTATERSGFPSEPGLYLPDCHGAEWISERAFFFLKKKSSSCDSVFSGCCQRGEVCIAILPAPAFLQRLLEASDVQSKEFRTNIRQYNMAFAFTSLGVNEDRVMNGRGTWVFRILGHLYHLLGPLEPNEGAAHTYAQLYVYDPVGQKGNETL